MCDSDIDTVNSQDDGVKKVCWSDVCDTPLMKATSTIFHMERKEEKLRAKIRHLKREAIKKDEKLKRLVDIFKKNDKRLQEYFNNSINK